VAFIGCEVQADGFVLAAACGLMQRDDRGIGGRALVRHQQPRVTPLLIRQRVSIALHRVALGPVRDAKGFELELCRRPVAECAENLF
jgi:hypothetical protein